MQWHTAKLEDVFKELKTSKKGLSSFEVKKRQGEYGFNKIESKKRATAFGLFLEQFKSFLVILLIIATAIAFFVGEILDAFAILAILILNAILGFWHEYKAEKAVEALKKYLTPVVVVVRDGKRQEVSAEELVLGDIVFLEEGKRVPADLRLIESINLKIDESSLTGESTPVGKDRDFLKDVSVADRKNMCFMGTLVSYGRGSGIVVGTGMTTEFGKIASLVQEREEPTPFQVKLEKFGKQIGTAVLSIAALLFFIGLSKNEPLVNMLLTSTSLAVAAVPEGLPAIVTITLAIGVQRMSRKNAIVRRLGSVESLGSATVIAADKTGTMTSNKMTVRKIRVSGKIIDVTGVGNELEGKFLLSGKEIDPLETGGLKALLQDCLFCNNASFKEDGSIIGDPTEGALLVLAKKSRINEDYKRVDEIPFSSERRMMTTINEVKGEHIAFTKGAAEVVLEKCSKIYVNKSLSREDKEKIIEEMQDFASKGLRVLAFAYRGLGKKYNKSQVEKDLTFLGLVGMIDPPTEETKHAVKICKEAGIKIIMITGDHKLTAMAVSKEIGLEGNSITGEELDKLSDKDLEKIVEGYNIYARVSPEHKLRVVNALKSKGHIVAVTGDGVNDAPALKKADIGIAMGIKGTDVAKEASDMILSDDNFDTIVSAVEEGRGVFDNVKKSVRYLLSANFGEVLIVTLSVLAGLPLPLLPIQLLWINLVTDGIPALALGLDPKEKDLMKRSPRNPREGLLSKEWLFIIAGAVLATASILFAFTSYLPDLNKARTVAFSTLVIFELFLVFNCRSETKSIFRNNLLDNKKLFLAVLISIILQVFIVQTEFLDVIFDTVPLSLEDWVKVFLFSSVALLVLPELLLKPLHSKSEIQSNIY